MSQNINNPTSTPTGTTGTTDTGAGIGTTGTTGGGLQTTGGTGTATGTPKSINNAQRAPSVAVRGSAKSITNFRRGPRTTPSRLGRRRPRPRRQRYIIKSQPSACISDMRPGMQRPSRLLDPYPPVADRRTSRRSPSRLPAPERPGFGPWCSVELTLPSPCPRGPRAVPPDCRRRCRLP